MRGLGDELRRELAAPAEEVAPRLVDDIQLLAVEGSHTKLRRNAIASARLEKVASIFAPVLNRT